MRNIIPPSLIAFLLALSLYVTAFSATVTYDIYNDNGIVSGSDVYIWEADGDFVDDFSEVTDSSAPEGVKYFQFTVDSAWGGWGIFFVQDPTNITRDLSSFVGGNLTFWVKTPINLKIEMQDTGPTGAKGSVYLNAYNWDGTDTWQEITIPLKDIMVDPGLDTAAIYSPFMISAEAPAVFLVDEVRFEHMSLEGATKVTFDGNRLLLNGSPFTVQGVNGNLVPVGTNPSFYDWSLDKRNYEIDIKLMKAVGANVFRTYRIPANQQAITAFYEQGIYTIITFWISPGDINNQEATKTRYLDFVDNWMHHPGILAWCIGNEVNFLNGYNEAQKATWYAMLDELARAGRLHEQAAGITPHPVTTANAEIAEIGNASLNADDASLPNLDFWSIQVYRGIYMDTLFSEYAAQSSKPVLVSEFGADAWDGTTGIEDQTTQRTQILQQWDSIEANLVSAAEPTQRCIGGIVFEWRDEWWKYEPGSWDVHDTTNTWTNYNYPDPGMHEEWWGMVGITEDPEERILREAFYGLMSTDYWRDTPFTTTPHAIVRCWVEHRAEPVAIEFTELFTAVRSRFEPITMSHSLLHADGILFNDILVAASFDDGAGVREGSVTIPRSLLIASEGSITTTVEYIIELADEFDRVTYYSKNGQTASEPGAGDRFVIPVSRALTRSIGPTGGSIQFPDGSPEDGIISITVPPQGIGQTVAIGVELLDPTALPRGPSFAQSTYPVMAYRLLPEGISFNKPVTVELIYFQHEQPLARQQLLEPSAYDEREFGVLYLNESAQAWELMTQDVLLDTDNNTVQFETDHFSMYGIFPLSVVPTTAATSYKPTQKIITPNGDGYNDLLVFTNLDGTGVAIRLYTVQGSEIRLINAPPYQWDGRDDNGDVVAIGVYIYQFKVDGKRYNGMVGVAK